MSMSRRRCDASDVNCAFRNRRRIEAGRAGWVSSNFRYVRVNLAFPTKKLRSICNCQTIAENEFGITVAKALRARLADLREVDTILELPAGRPSEVAAKPHNLYSVQLGRGYRIVLSANHENLPLTKSGKIDWSKVTRAMILRIEAYHGR